MNNFKIKSLLCLLISLNAFYACESEEDPHEPSIREDAGELAGEQAGAEAGAMSAGESAGEDSIAGEQAGDISEGGTSELAGDLVEAGDQAGVEAGEMTAGVPVVAGDIVEAGEEDDCLVELVCDEGFIQVESCDVNSETEGSEDFCIILSACDKVIYCQEVLEEPLPEPSPFPEPVPDMGM
jgi:hypothetical protein